MAVCAGTLDDHCCHLAGVVCPHLEAHTVPGRRWACGLRRELGSWARVHTDARYLADVKPRLESVPSLVGVDCGDWPRAGEACAVCGVTGG